MWVIIKLSGEFLRGENDTFSYQRIKWFANELKSANQKDYEIGIVCGGGNIFRAREGIKKGIDKLTGDRAGMLATLINSLLLYNVFSAMGFSTAIFSSFGSFSFAPVYSVEGALSAFRKGKLVLFGGGVGSPYFTTDSAAALRAVELKADLVIKGTRVKGVYDDDPEKNANAKFYPVLTYSELLAKGLQVMDLTAVSLCMEYNIPILVMDIYKSGNLKSALQGEKIGTIIRRK